MCDSPCGRQRPLHPGREYSLLRGLDTVVIHNTAGVLGASGRACRAFEGEERVTV